MQSIRYLFDECRFNIIKTIRQHSGSQNKSIIKYQSASNTESIEKAVHKLWDDISKEYSGALALKFLEGYYGTSAHIQNMRNDTNALRPLITGLLENRLQEFDKMKRPFIEKITELINETSDNSEMSKMLKSAFYSKVHNLEDRIHSFGITAKLEAIKDENVKQYIFESSDDDRTCPECSSLDQNVYSVTAIEEGTNYPLIHPNCRCSINAYVKETEQGGKEDRFSVFLTSIANMYNENIKPFVDFGIEFLKQSEMESFLKVLPIYLGNYQTIKINDSEYKINKFTFNGISILPNRKFVVPENVTDIDRKLLELMEIRDRLPNSTSQRTDIIWQISDIAQKNAGNFSVDISKPYSYYQLGEDITDKLNSYMKSHESQYAYMHGKASWVLNMLEFKDIVGNKSKMDLKNQIEWQKSAFIYNGEIVDQDAIGNINYGYFGAFCNIPDLVLSVGAGYAQIKAGTAEPEFFISFGDDPRDQARINQGIDIYRQNHPEDQPLIFAW